MYRKGSVVYFATNNAHKLEEARLVLEEFGIEVRRVQKDSSEVQSNSLEEIARTCVVGLAERVGSGVIVEDAGLFVEVLGGFPGPYSSYVHRTIGCGGLLKLLGGVENRSAEFRSAVAFSEGSGEPVVFSGKASGVVVYRERGTFGFGFDPVFAPRGGSGKTFAEMPLPEKNRLSHRADALRRFGSWFTRRF